jgi:hypothetical protein
MILQSLLSLAVLFLDLLCLECLVKYLGASGKDWAGSLGSLVVISGTRSSCETIVGGAVVSFLGLPLPRLIGLGVGSTCSAGGGSICSTATSSIGSAEVGSTEVGSAGVGSAQVGSLQVSSAGVGSAGVGSAGIG